MARLAWFAFGLVIGAALVAAPAAWLHDPVDSADHVARECRLVADLESRRMADETLRARDTPLPYQVFRAEKVSGSPQAFEPTRWFWKPIDQVLARRGRKAVAPIDCRPALDAAQVPVSVLYQPVKPRSALRVAYSRAVFWPGDGLALIGVRTCHFLPAGYAQSGGWTEDASALLLRREDGMWRPIENKPVLLLQATASIDGHATACFGR